MTMQCTKTGCHVYLKEYGEYVYGDAHMVGNVLVLRIVQRSFSGPLADRLHYEVGQAEGWFDKNRSDGSSTLLTTQYIDHGYEGKEL